MNNFSDGFPLSPGQLGRPSHSINTDKTVAVATDNYWEPIDQDTPRGVKVQLLGRGGVAVYGELHHGNAFWTHWAPLPKRRD